MSELTKQQLRDELISHGIKPPSPAARKSEFVKKYEKYVAPVAKSRGEFSSDDEGFITTPKDANTKRVSMDRSISSSSSMVINGLDISNLDDDELYSRLQDLGSPVGPIVDTTRSVYRKKLFVLLGGRVPDAAPPAYNGTAAADPENEEEYSDNEPEVSIPERPRRILNQSSTHSVRTYTSKTTSSPRPSTSSQHFSETRQRIFPSAGETSLHNTSLVFDDDLLTPSPRRSLRTATSSSSHTTTSTYRRTVNNNGKTSTRFATSDGHDAVDSPSHSPPGVMSSVMRFLVKLLILCLIIPLVYYIYQNYETESPFKSIEEMARQALEAASGEEGVLPPKDSNPSPPPQQQPVNN